MSTEYYLHEVKRHNRSIQDAMSRACSVVYTETAITYQIKGTAWSLWSPSQRVKIAVIKKSASDQRQPSCEIIIDRPKTKENRYVYEKALAVLNDWTEHSGNTRLVGHLQRSCSFLPRLEVKMNYDLSEHQ